MPTKIEITCFTDLKASTALAENLGNRAFVSALQDHLRFGKLLAGICNGQYVKNIGDAHMVRFEFLEDALTFALRLQEYCGFRPSVFNPGSPVRVSLFQGAVEPIGDDVFGTGVNRAARLQGHTEPSTVTLNDDLRTTLVAAFSGSSANALCDFIGEVEFKGVVAPPKHIIHQFNYLTYRKMFPQTSLGTLVVEHLRRSGVELSNVGDLDVACPATVIWPVVPRDLVTAIHRAQIEVIRLFAAAGWKIKVLVADCGGEDEYKSDYVNTFCEALTR